MSLVAPPRGFVREANFMVNGVRRLIEVARILKPAYKIAINKDHYARRGSSAYYNVRGLDAAQVADKIRYMVYEYLLEVMGDYDA